MYIIADMIDLGLLDGQQWPSEAHKRVAMNIGLCNSRVTKRDALIEIVQAVIAIPMNEIRRVTPQTVVSKYNVPYVNLS